MYTRILVPLENGKADRAILQHAQRLAALTRAALVLIHVADGFAARNFEALDLRESEEMRRDRSYLDETVQALTEAGVAAEAVLAVGDPATEIVKAADRERCDLIAMAVHGHRGLDDLFRGSVANAVRHRVMIPVLMVRAAPGEGGAERPA